MFEAERDAVIAACRSLANSGLIIGTAGNVSVRINEELVAISPSSTPYDLLVTESICLVDMRGRHVHGTHEPSSELQLHLAIYEARAAGAVVHTHSTAAVACSTLVSELPPIHYYLNGVGGRLRVAEYFTYGTSDLARAVVRALGDTSTAALMANHGAVALGSTLDEAMERAALVEWLCDLWLRTRPLGEPALLTEANLQNARDRGRRNVYEESRLHSSGALD